MLAPVTRTISVTVVLVGFALAQAPKEPFRAQTDLVVVPFQVLRGSRSISNLKAADVVLLEDGVPRGFTVFEAPPDHPVLELVVMLDISDIGGGFWNPKNLRDLTSHWNEAMAQAILEEAGSTIRVSLYQFDRDRERRLGRAAGDPSEFVDALRQLGDPIPAGQALDLALPPGAAKPWPLVAAIATLQDSTDRAAVAGTAARALVVFSKGVDGVITPKDLAGKAVAANVPVYPVALAVASAMYGPGQSGEVFHPYDEGFESLGDLTGGRQFDVTDSLTAAHLRDILETVKAHALARIRSNYTVGFVPSPSGSPREHKLEVRLAAKSSAKPAGGKRSATY
jgi:hypothetical protein